MALLREVGFANFSEQGSPPGGGPLGRFVSPWILSVLTTDRLSRNYELVTKHNLKHRRYYHQFDY